MAPRTLLARVALVAHVALLAGSAAAQPGGGGPPGGGALGGLVATTGQTSSTECATHATCAQDGSANYVSRNLTFDASTGLFSGSLTTNKCNRWPSDNAMVASNTPTCVRQALPAYSATSAAPLRGAVGYTLYGVSIYGPFEAGFQAGFVCDKGTCEGGVDVPACRSKMARDCGGTSALKDYLLADGCGFHATPYHAHADLPCDYDISAAGSHSPLVGYSLDGRGIYGRWESSGKLPTDLDACGGHYGPVPAITVGNVTYPAASKVYHYHLSPHPPYTLGCFGPVASLAQCKSLYPTCGTGYTTMCTMNGKIEYDTDCPCYSQGGEEYNQGYEAASDCPVLEGLTNITATSGGEEVVVAETGAGLDAGASDQVSTASGAATSTASGASTRTSVRNAATATAAAPSTTPSASLSGSGRESGSLGALMLAVVFAVGLA
ncbi:hypothetical protein DFJ74DRAFT_111807 [Hyaloraphidium curvatum]|nr:hypothetical protein DFJ74DRAFT_111807 [Hyaloraphidium curvatum]